MCTNENIKLEKREGETKESKQLYKGHAGQFTAFLIERQGCKVSVVRYICRVEIYTIVLLGQLGKLPYAYLRLSTRMYHKSSTSPTSVHHFMTGNAALRRAPSASRKSYVMIVLIG